VCCERGQVVIIERMYLESQDVITATGRGILLRSLVFQKAYLSLDSVIRRA
jgi:hypothetical protein